MVNIGFITFTLHLNLSTLRKQIDQIDTKILELIQERLNLIPEIVEYKKRHNIAVYQKKREEEIYKQLEKLSIDLGVNFELVKNIWEQLIQESRCIEHDLIKNKERNKKKIKLKVDFSKLKVRRKKIKLNISLYEIFQSIYANFDYFYFLESLGEDTEFSRKSYIGFDPIHVFSAKNNQFFIDNQEIKCQNPLEELKTIFPSNLLKSSAEFVGGLMGYFGYESLKYVEDLPYFKSSTDWNDFEFGLYLDGLVFNHSTGELEYFYLDEDRSERVLEVLKNTFDLLPLTVEVLDANITDAEYMQGVEKIKKHIVNGDIFQGVLSQRFNYRIKGSTLTIYEKLREINPSPHMFFLKFNQRDLIGSSPELVARVEKGTIETFPIAGTRGRGKTKNEEKRLEKELLHDEKEIAEHMMLVDMARNDLGKICEYSSVKVKKLMYLKKYSHVQHMVSNVQGKLKKDTNIIDAVLAQMPMGTVSGSPRLEAIKILNNLESTVRGPYGGAVGFLSFSKECIFALMIRSLFINGEEAYNQAGAGLVYDSVPSYELKEVQKKSQVIKKALGN